MQIIVSISFITVEIEIRFTGTNIVVTVTNYYQLI